MTRRLKLLLAIAIIGLTLIGLFFFFLSQIEGNQISEGSFPSNQTLPIINSNGNTADSFSTNANNSETETYNIRAISDQAVAGYYVINNDLETRVRYIEQTTGNVYEYVLANDSRNRLTSTSLPRITSATWLGPETIMIKYDESGTNVNYLANLDLSSGTLSGTIFPYNLLSITADPNNSEQILYLTENTFGGSNLYSYNTDSDENTFLQSFNLIWLELFSEMGEAANEVFAVSKPNENNARQAIYRLTNNYRSARAVENALRPQYGYIAKTDYHIGISDDLITTYDITTEQVASTELSTVGNKCGISPTVGDDIICAVLNRDYRNWPFNWYRGEIRPTETLVSINPDFGDFYSIIELGDEYDVSSVTVTNDYIYFIGRTTGQLFEVPRNNF